MNATPGAPTVDLHAHSTASDGTAEPGTIPAIAAAAGVAAIALTDHDSINGVAAAMAAAASARIRLVPGVELSATEDGYEVHVLGLHIDVNGHLETALEKFRTERAERAALMVARLTALGVQISFADVEREAAGGAIGRPHVARALVAIGECESLRDAFDRYLGFGRAAFVPKPKMSVREAVELIHAAGGLAIWAHPGQEGRLERIERFARSGMDGVEVRHPSHSDDDARRLLSICEHLKLVPSGGSDWHGGAAGRRTLGAMQVPFEWLERQDARIASRGSAGVS